MGHPQDPNDPRQQASPQQYGPPSEYGAGPPQYGPAPPPEPQHAPQPSMPSTVNAASIALFVLVGLVVVNAIITFANLQSIIDRSMSQGRPTPGMTPEQAEALARTAILATTVVMLILAGLFLWLTIMVRKGRNWARITSTVFLAIGIVFGLLGLGTPGPALVTVIGIVMLILEIAALVLLWLKASSEYFRASARPAYY